jgi:hypothetical protein
MLFERLQDMAGGALAPAIGERRLPVVTADEVSTAA